ncbi:MAG: hypothetical protein JJU33_11480 [Phycisphaerales bacterium]|nr:hypothetical protein [Phycisphaerales bacterium]
MSGTDTSAPSDGSETGPAQQDTSDTKAKRLQRLRDWSRSERVSLVVKRWVSITLCGIAAASVCVIATPFLPESRAFVIERLASLGWPILMAVLVATIVAAMFPSFKGRSEAFFGGRHFVVYPPIWVSAAIGSVLYVLVASNQVVFTAETGGDVAWLIAAVSILSVFGDCVYRMAGRPQNKATIANVSADTTVSDLLNNPEQFDKWLASDREITGVGNDLFGMTSIAKEIAGLVARDCVDPPTIAVLGQVGSGKSSLGWLVHDELQANPGSLPTDFVQLSLWPYDTVDAAVKAILDRVIDRVSCCVPVLALRGIPQRYAAMMSDSSLLERLLAASISSAEPDSLLKRIDQVLFCVGRRLVLWIDDLERFSPGGDHETGHAAGPIESLLYELDRCKRISMVLATTPKYLQHGDLKIARYHRYLAVGGTQCATDICRAAAKRLSCDSNCGMSSHAKVALSAGTIRELKVVLRETRRLVERYREEFGANQDDKYPCIDGAIYDQVVLCVTLSRIAPLIWNEVLREQSIELPIVVDDVPSSMKRGQNKIESKPPVADAQKIRCAIRELIAREKLEGLRGLFGLLQELWSASESSVTAESDVNPRLFEVKILGDVITVSRSSLFGSIFIIGELCAFGGDGEP